jgi:hypothetical protein
MRRLPVSSDVTTVPRVATRMFGGDQADVGHELPGRGEAAQVASLGDDGHRGQEADAADGLEGRQQLRVRARRGALRQGAVSRRLMRSAASRTTAW